MRAFTLIEAVVVVSIVLILSAFILFNLSSFNRSFAIQREAGKVAVSLRKAQTFALAVREFSPGQFPGYGMYVSISSPTSYVIFGDPQNGGTFQRYDAALGEGVETPQIENGVRITQLCGNIGLVSETCSLTEIHIFYLRPDPTIVLTGCLGATCGSYSNMRLALTFPDGALTKQVFILTTGQVSIQ